jgi:hypothetical protein
LDYFHFEINGGAVRAENKQRQLLITKI